MGFGRVKTVTAESGTAGAAPDVAAQFRLRSNPARVVLQHSPGCYNVRLVRRWASLDDSWSWGMWCAACDAGRPDGRIGDWTIGEELPPRWTHVAEGRKRPRSRVEPSAADAAPSTSRELGIRAGRAVALPRSLRAVLTESLGSGRRTEH